MKRTHEYPAAPADLLFSNQICVPSFKQSVVGTARNTWGKLKTLHR